MASSKPRPRPKRGANAAARASTPRRVSPALQVAAYMAVFAAAFLVNLPTLRYEFLTSWDDPMYVVKNPWIRSWSAENLVHIFTQPYFANFLPLHLVSYMVDYSFWKLNPFGYHLDSVFLNATNAVLALLVVRRLFGSFALAFLAALLFAVHPSHVEAVAWISIRKDLLSTAFLLLTVYFYARAIEGKSLRRGDYAAAFGCFTLGLLSKVTLVALPLFLLLLDASRPAGRPRRSWKAALVNKAPFLAVGLWLVRLNSVAQVKAQAAYTHEPLRYLAVKGQSAWNYMALLTGLPRGRPIYDTPQIQGGIATVAAVLGLLVLPVILAWAYRRGWRIVSLGSGWIFTLLLPAIAFPLVTYMADRYLYAPSLGFCWILAAGILALSERMGQGALRAGAAAILVAVPFLGFAYRTAEYNPVWANSDSLWTYAAAHSTDYRASNNLAQAKANEGKWTEAERLYRLGAQYDNVVSWQGIATVYYNTKRYGEAQQAIDKAFAIAGTKGADDDIMADLYYSRGAIEYVTGRRSQAIEDWTASLRLRPQDARTREWLDVARGLKPPPK